MTQKTVWKYQLPVADSFALTMPAGATVLSVQAQGDQNHQPVLWALVDPGAPNEERRFRMAGTGHPVTAEPGNYVGTFQLYDGGFVGHVWEVL